jgi:hypothetical protein
MASASLRTSFWTDCRQTFHNCAPTSRSGLDANTIIDGRSNPLLAAQVTFGRLHRNVPQEKLDLLQLASRCVTEPSTGPPQIVGRQLHHADASGGFLHNVLNGLDRHSISPCPAYFVDPAEQPSPVNGGCCEPIVEFGSYPVGNWNRSNVTSLSNQINDGQWSSRCRR